jgi:hypothetical protein
MRAGELVILPVRVVHLEVECVRGDDAKAVVAQQRRSM